MGLILTFISQLQRGDLFQFKTGNTYIYNGLFDGNHYYSLFDKNSKKSAYIYATDKNNYQVEKVGKVGNYFDWLPNKLPQKTFLNFINELTRAKMLKSTLTMPNAIMIATSKEIDFKYLKSFSREKFLLFPQGESKRGFIYLIKLK